MFKNYLKIAIRNIHKNKLFAAINILGLAVGMACFILISLWVQDELSHDEFHLNKNELYLINIKHPGDLNGYGDPNAPYALAPILAQEFPEIINYTRIEELDNIITCTFKYQPDENQSGQKMFYESNVWRVDTSFFTMFTFPFIHGNPETALGNQNSLVITDKIAEKYFGRENPLGKKLTLNNRRDYMVTGVVHIPANSHLQFNFVAPLKNKKLRDWNWSDPSYILTNKNISVEELRDKLAGSLNKHYPHPLPGIFKVDILPMSKVHLYFGRKTQVYIFSLIAIFIMLIACINYMNLATASSANRAREVGLRKVVGGSRSEIIRQFFVESTLLSSAALIPALILAEAFLPLLNSLTSKQLVLFPFINPYMYPLIIGLVIIVGIVSGSYPSLFLTSYKPVNALRAHLKFKTNRSLFRIVSVVGQFVISILLIVCTMVVFKQLSFIQNRPLGFKTDYVINIPINNELKSGLPGYKNELLRNPNILTVTAGQVIPFAGDFKTGGVEWDNKNPQLVPVVRYSIVSPDYFETFKMEIVKGRSFSKNIFTDRYNYIINEEAAKYMGMKDPVGKRLKLWKRDGKIIGVVKDFHHVSLHKEIMPQVFTITPEYYNALKYIFVKIRSANVPDTINYIKSTTGYFAPGYPFKFSFLDKGINDLYQSEQKLGKLFSYFAFIAIFISCLGIFGLAAFTAEQRTKEIGIRKAFGASIPDIVLLLTRQFTRWVLLANIIAWPVAYLAMNRWLQDFAYRTSIGIVTFILSALAALVIALLTVSYQSIRASVANPVEALRYE
jgi:putative ABC transport system permease protein